MTQARLTDRRKVDIDTRTRRYIKLVKISFPLVEPTWRPSGRPQLNVILNMSGVQLLLASFSGVRFEAGVNFLGHRAAQLASYRLCFWNVVKEANFRWTTLSRKEMPRVAKLGLPENLEVDTRHLARTEVKLSRATEALRIILPNE
jgi:hypothetical protein